MRTAASLALAASCVTAAVVPRVALYVGPGSSAGSGGNFTASLRALAAAGTIASVDLFTVGADVASKLTRAAYDVVVFPGGGGSAEAAGIGKDGAIAVKEFVAGGGGYYGTCAGGFLALTATCCDVVTPGYCGGATGCKASSYGLGLLPLAAAEPWDRGHGPVLMTINDAAIAALRLDAAVYSARNVSVRRTAEGRVGERGACAGHDQSRTYERRRGHRSQQGRRRQ